MPPKVKQAKPIDLSNKGDDKPLDLPPANDTKTDGEVKVGDIVVTDLVSGDPPVATDPQNPWAPPVAVEVKTLVFNVPTFLPPDYPEGGAQSRRIDHVDVHLTQRQSEALRQLFAGIDRVPHLRLANGRPLYYQVDAVRWLLDQIADQLPECAALPAAKNWE